MPAVAWNKIPVGKLPDREIARLYGICRTSVWNRRVKLGIPSVRSFSAEAAAGVRAIILGELSRYTPQRVGEIWERVQAVYGKLSERTIYRGLARLLRENKVKRAPLIGYEDVESPEGLKMCNPYAGYVRTGVR